MIKIIMMMRRAVVSHSVFVRGFASKKLYVGNLDYYTTSEQLEEHLASAAPPTNVHVLIDQQSDGSRNRGFGFAEFASEEDAQIVLSQLHESFLDGSERPLILREAIEKGARAEGGARGQGAADRSDWVCGCGFSNFSFRGTCKSCDAPRPAGGAAGGGAPRRARPQPMAPPVFEQLKLAENVYVAPGAAVVGHVTIGEGSSVWFGASIRGDHSSITLGSNCTVQDNATLHGDADSPLQIGDNCVIGHNAVVHACTVGDNSMVGMGAVVLTGAKLGSNVLVGANALVKENQEVPDNSLVVGVGEVHERDAEASEKQREIISHAVTEYEKLRQKYAQGEFEIY